MTSSRSRRVMLAVGRASARTWLRAAHRDTAMLRRLTSVAYDVHAAALPWPTHHVLQAHLVFSVLPGAAVYTALQQQGESSEEAARLVIDALAVMARPRRRVLRRMVHSDVGRRLFLRAAATSYREFPPPGWQATWRERSPRRVAFDMTRCYDLDMLRRLDATAIASGYCAVDDVLYTGLHPQFGWSRTGTLATGAPCCDFCFEDLPPGPVRGQQDRIEAVSA